MTIAVLVVHFMTKFTQLCGGNTLCDAVKIAAPGLGQHTAAEAGNMSKSGLGRGINSPENA